LKPNCGRRRPDGNSLVTGSLLDPDDLSLLDPAAQWPTVLGERDRDPGGLNLLNGKNGPRTHNVESLLARFQFRLLRRSDLVARTKRLLSAATGGDGESEDRHSDQLCLSVYR